MAYGMCVGKVRILSAASSAFYHCEDPHIRISTHPHFTCGLGDVLIDVNVIELLVIVDDGTGLPYFTPLMAPVMRKK